MLLSCKADQKSSNVKRGPSLINFEIIPSTETGIKFRNDIIENDQYNYLNYEAMYNGGGCAVLDVNKDGLLDIFFVSNQQKEKLYLNKGNFKFEDISSSANIEGGDEWSAGVSIVDINSDGYDDIYISCHLLDDPIKRKNKLYINQKNNQFLEQANSYGIADIGYSIQSYFFDYDNDSDLDLLVINQPPNNNEIRNQLKFPEALYSNHLYENISGKFKDVTLNSGVLQLGYCLSSAITDLNNDGWLDIYICNDYNMPDVMLLNSKSKTFLNETKTLLKHTSQFSMGSEAADVNNDGWMDIYTADMVSEDHYRNKANMSGMNIPAFWNLISLGFQYQYMFNALQLNRGNGLFSEIAQLSGISKTDWSWAPLIADFNNDGLKDLYVTNGLKRDVRNKDFSHLRDEYLKNKNNPNYNGEKYNHATELLDKAPSVKLVNYMYQNDGELHFTNVAQKANMNHPSFSNGAAYGDLDNDGDLDLIVNNIDDEAFIYKNKTDNANNFIRLNLIGEGQNIKSYGARVCIYSSIGIQLAEINPNRGYLSACESTLHFGLGNENKVDSIVVRWQSGKTIVLNDPKLNKLISLDENKGTYRVSQIPIEKNIQPYTTEVESSTIDKISHKENLYDDYKTEVLMPHKMSTLGPCLAVGDVNGDKLEDFYLGGSVGFEGQLFLQNQNGEFNLNDGPWQQDKASEDSDALIFDIEDDGDFDLIVTSGGNEYPENSPKYQTRLYINQGAGNFINGTHLLPKIPISAGVVKAFDMNGDMKKDLFIGGRQVPGKYGVSASSKILIYKNGKYIDETQSLCNDMNSNFGNVTTANYVDIDRDKDLDLLVAGEWMNIKVMINDGNGKFTDESKKWGTDQLFGWWNCISAADLDQDGDADIVAGNLGTNIKFKANQEKPMYVYLDDFDKNNTWDTYLGTYDKNGKLYPVRGRQCSSEQMPFIKEKFQNYDAFANATLDEILDDKKNSTTIIKKATEFRSGILVNQENKSFEFKPLPIETQISPIQDIILYDFNKDGKPDIAYGGNYFNREIETTRSDAGIGGICIQENNARFKSISSYQAGIYFNSDLRKMKLIKINSNYFILAANNNSNIQLNLIN